MLNTITTNTVKTLARKAAAGTLKRIYDNTGNERIYRFRNALQADFNRLDNAEYNDTANIIGKTISYAYDIYLVAYDYLWEQIAVNDLTAETEISITLKNGNIKTRTVYQWACVKVRQYIYSNRSIENNGKYTYIEDLSRNTDETGSEALDREYIRMGKYDGIATYHDHTTYAELLNLFTDHPTLTKIIKLRMRGMSVTDMAAKMKVSHQAISKQLAKARAIINDEFPNMTRGFKRERNYK